MKKVFFFLAFLSFLFVSCSSNNEQNKQEDSSSSAFISSSDVTTPSSSSIALPSSSSSALPSSSDGTLPSSSDDGTLPSSSDGTPPSSSSDVPLSSSISATTSSSSRATASSSSRAAASSSSRATSGSSSSATTGASSSSKQSDPSGGLTCADPVSATATDYSDMNNWSVYTADDKLTKDVDIFLLYPTSINGTGDDVCPYPNVNHSGMRTAVDRWYSGIKALVTTHANAYLPYYRQPPIGCSGNSSMTGGAAMEDVVAAFQYYLTHINKGQRPFMTLGFSQGSLPLWELAENRFEKICGAEFGAATRKNHIVTYATGIPYRGTISASKPVKFSTSYNDINVITAWNPYWESDTACTGSNQLGVRATSGPVTNPITWTIDQDYHEMTENPKLNQNTILGARSYEKLGILLVKRKTEPATPPGCGSTGQMYMGQHGQDIPYFSESIKQNMQDRIEAWKAKYP